MEEIIYERISTVDHYLSSRMKRCPKIRNKASSFFLPYFPINPLSVSNTSLDQHFGLICFGNSRAKPGLARSWRVTPYEQSQSDVKRQELPLKRCWLTPQSSNCFSRSDNYLHKQNFFIPTWTLLNERSTNQGGINGMLQKFIWQWNSYYLLFYYLY